LKTLLSELGTISASRVAVCFHLQGATAVELSSYSNGRLSEAHFKMNPANWAILHRTIVGDSPTEMKSLDVMQNVVSSRFSSSLPPIFCLHMFINQPFPWSLSAIFL
jgi:hypothetical protein